MQIDFHHGITYVIARLAGFEHLDAQKVAYSAQYVDDAVDKGLLRFDNGAMFNCASSAHKMLDYRNMEQLSNRRCWVPFHFLPGNGGMPAGQNPQGSFINKLICRPNSHVAQDMLASCLANKDKPFGLQQLGIAMHVYADTWAHQDFVGIVDEFNDVYDINVRNDVPHTTWTSKVSDFFGDLWDDTKSGLVGDTLPLGHGSVLSFPDLPYLHWDYKRRKDGQVVERRNYELFLDAAEHMCRFMQRWLGQEPEGLSDEDKIQLSTLMRTIIDENAENRHQQWLDAITNGAFRFGPQPLDYIAEGEGSWKHTALGEPIDERKNQYRYNHDFLSSDWKYFHDALLVHRFAIIHEILPRYGICVA